MKGNVLKCDLTPEEKNYNYSDTIKDLESKYGFTELGEGSFGVLLNNGNCVVKIIKDIRRCNELTKERQIYERISNNKKSKSFLAKFPGFYLYNELDTFCHFNIQKIFSPLSGYGNIYDDDEFGHGFVVTEDNGKILLIQEGKPVKKKILKKDDVYAIDKPGNLIHFYINHFDSNLKEKLDNNQGILLGKNYLEKMFSEEVIKIYAEAIGELLSFLIFDLLVIPTDIEIVLGTSSLENRVVIPYIYDFNECDFYNQLNENTLFRIAKSMYNKNGKSYFPNKKNPYYNNFSRGFLKFSQSEHPDSNGIIKNYTEEKSRVLELYNSFFV